MKYEYQKKGYRIKKVDLERDWQHIYRNYCKAVVTEIPKYFPWGTKGHAKAILLMATTSDGFWFEELEDKIRQVGISPKSIFQGAYSYVYASVPACSKEPFYTALKAYVREHKIRNTFDWE